MALPLGQTQIHNNITTLLVSCRRVSPSIPVNEFANDLSIKETGISWWQRQKAYKNTETGLKATKAFILFSTAYYTAKLLFL